jgi:formate/nitrite transporter FocA (FNT family)
LFTENTLYPVALVLAEKREFWNTMRLWAVVLPSNVSGALAFAFLAVRSPAFDPAVVGAMGDLGLKAIAHPASTIFWSGVIGGWMIALTAWLVSGSHSVTGSVMLIWMLTFIVGLGNFAHCIATSCEVLVAVLTHRAPSFAYPLLFFSRDSRQHLRRRRAGDDSRVRTGHLRRRRRVAQERRGRQMKLNGKSSGYEARWCR